MMKNFFHSIRCLALLGIVVAACNAPINTAAPTQTILVGTGAKVIPFYTSENDLQQIKVLQDLVGEYQRVSPDVEIDIVLITSASRGRRLLTALASGADLGIFEMSRR